MTIHLATDHAGFALKEKVKKFLLEKGYEVVDHGAKKLVPDDDYPVFISLAAAAVSKDDKSVGVIFGGSGQGEAMVANRTKGVRAAVFYGGPEEIIELSRQHNNANILSLGARFIDEQDALYVVERWLNVPFSNVEKHAKRIAMF